MIASYPDLHGWWNVRLVFHDEPKALIERNSLKAAFEPPVGSARRKHRPHEFSPDTLVACVRSHYDRIDEYEGGL